MCELDSYIDVPFHFRHQCWFCAEPASVTFTFPQSRSLVFDCPHPILTLPSCTECKKIALNAETQNIWQVAAKVKSYLVRHYRKDLAIGLNWTKDELANAGFEDGNFAGFQKSAWFMYEVARDRVNFNGWPLVLNNVELTPETAITEVFLFDGVRYPSINQCIEHYVYSFDLDLELFRKSLAIIGVANFAMAVRFCRLNVGATPNEKRMALRSLSADGLA